MKRPNVLLLYVDQMRIDSLGCYGNRMARTPNLDELASKATRFDRFYVQNPVCSPSRMSLLSGKYCSRIGVGCNGVEYPVGRFPILPKYLQAAGYRTANIGKLHFVPNEFRDHNEPYPHYRELGFDIFIGTEAPDCEDYYLAWLKKEHPNEWQQVVQDNDKRQSEFNINLDIGKPMDAASINVWHAKAFESDKELTQAAFIAEESVQFLKNHDERQPFLLVSSFYSPHELVNPPIEDDYLSDDWPESPVRPENPEKQGVLPQLSEKGWRRLRQYYQYLVNHVDENIGKILAALKETGLDENTIVIFTSDHGEYCGDHGRMGKGMPGHDVIVNMPLLIKCPGTKPQVVEDLLEAVDIIPTILDLCGIPKPKFLDGKSMADGLYGGEMPEKEYTVIEHFDDQGHASVSLRSRRYLYNCTEDGQELLFDYEKDPKQRINCLEENPDVVSEFRKQMLCHMLGSIRSEEKTAAY